jgi:hypothetical protein
MADSLDSLIAGLQNYVVAPLNAFGLGGFVFDVQGEARARLDTEITDHYSEDNRALQDHIAIKPKRITLKGYVGELVYTQTTGGSSSIVQQVTQKLTSISGYLPALSAAATQAQQLLANPSASDITLNSVAGALPAAADLYALVKNSLGAFGDMKNQQNAYNYFNSCREQKILMGIQTPWEFLTNMAIETIDAIQSEDTKFMTDFSITFKQLRIAQTQTATTALSGTGGIESPGGVVAQGPAALQGSATTSQGIVPGLTLPAEILSGLGPISSATGVHSLKSITGLESLFNLQ